VNLVLNATMHRVHKQKIMFQAQNFK
jgi:hypothetical protein